MRHFKTPKPLPNFDEFKKAILAGNERTVIHYLSQKNCQLTDPFADTGYPDEDGYNSTTVNSLLYDAVPHPKILNILLKDDRFEPYGINNDAFYRALMDGSIEALRCFYENKKFTFPENALIKAAELGGEKVIQYLLSLNIASSETISNACDIAKAHKDTAIIEMLDQFLEHTSKTSRARAR